MRPLGIAAFWLMLAALVGALVLGGSARAGLRLQEGTPAATPAATAATTNVVTLAARYVLDPSGAHLNLFPLETGADQVVAFDAGGNAIGRAEFPEEGLPVVTLGDSRFEAYLRYEGDPNNGQRWIWFNDEDGVRPATLVIQVNGTEGTYANFFGTATFVSRDEGSAGGVLVMALRPPTPAEGAAEEAPAEEAPAEEAPAEEAAAEEAPAEEIVVETVPTEPPAEEEGGL